MNMNESSYYIELTDDFVKFNKKQSIDDTTYQIENLWTLEEFGDIFRNKERIEKSKFELEDMVLIEDSNFSNKDDSLSNIDFLVKLKEDMSDISNPAIRKSFFHFIKDQNREFKIPILENEDELLQFFMDLEPNIKAIH